MTRDLLVQQRRVLFPCATARWQVLAVTGACVKQGCLETMQVFDSRDLIVDPNVLVYAT